MKALTNTLNSCGIDLIIRLRERNIGRNRIPAIAALIFAAILFVPSAGAWGRLGHRVASTLAEERLTPSVLAAVHHLLGPGVSLADISTWADEQRSIPSSGPRHYVDVPITESRYDSKYCQPGGCVVSKIHDFQRVLQDPKAGKARRNSPDSASILFG